MDGTTALERRRGLEALVVEVSAIGGRHCWENKNLPWPQNLGFPSPGKAKLHVFHEAIQAQSVTVTPLGQGKSVTLSNCHCKQR